MYNFNGSTFTILLHQVSPFCGYSTFPNGSIQQIDYSFELNLLQVLAEKLNFKVTFLGSNQTSAGALRNGSWDGAVRQLLDKKVDVSICDNSITLDRSKVISFTHVTTINELAFISQAPPRTEPDSVVTMPFEPSIWLSIAFLTLCLLFTLKWTVKGQASLYDIVSSLIAICLRQPSNLSLENTGNFTQTKARLLTGLWMLALLILSNLYCSVFYSILTVQKYGHPIDTIEDIVRITQTDSHFILVRKNSMTVQRFTDASLPEESLYKLIIQHIKRTSQFIDSSFENVIPIVEADPRNVVVRSRLTLIVQRLLYANLKLHIGSDSLGKDPIAFMLPKGSILLAPFNRLIQYCHENGLNTFWLENTGYRLAKNRAKNSQIPEELTERRKDNKNLSLTHLKSVFTILICGIIFSVIGFCVEFLFIYVY